MTDQQRIEIDDCWNRIGVWAHREQRSCEELKKFSHCRNCPVYKDAGRVLLQRPVELLEQEDLPEPVIQNPDDYSYVCFRVGNEWFSIATQKVGTTINPLPVRKIPHLAGDCIEGICYDKGDSLLVINLAALIPGSSQQESPDEGKKSFQRFLLMDSPMGALALRVNEVWGTQRCGYAEIKQLGVADNDKQSSLVRYRLPWEGGEISDIEIEVLYQMLKQQL